MKRLSKSATDLSPCKRKKHSNSEDEEFEEGSRSESQGQMAVMRRLRDLALLNPAYLSQLFLSSAQPNVSSIRAEEDLDQNIITTTNTTNQRFLMSEVLQLR